MKIVLSLAVVSALVATSLACTAEQARADFRMCVRKARADGAAPLGMCMQGDDRFGMVDDLCCPLCKPAARDCSMPPADGAGAGNGAAPTKRAVPVGCSTARDMIRECDDDEVRRPDPADACCPSCLRAMCTKETASGPKCSETQRPSRVRGKCEWECVDLPQCTDECADDEVCRVRRGDDGAPMAKCVKKSVVRLRMKLRRRAIKAIGDGYTREQVREWIVNAVDKFCDKTDDACEEKDVEAVSQMMLRRMRHRRNKRANAAAGEDDTDDELEVELELGDDDGSRKRASGDLVTTACKDDEDFEGVEPIAQLSPEEADVTDSGAATLVAGVAVAVVAAALV